MRNPESSLIWYFLWVVIALGAAYALVTDEPDREVVRWEMPSQ
jgi:hypothetical protein